MTTRGVSKRYFLFPRPGGHRERSEVISTDSADSDRDCFVALLLAMTPKPLETAGRGVHRPGRLWLSRRCGRSRRVAVSATSAGRAWGSPSPHRPRRYGLIDTSALIGPPAAPDLTAFAANCRNLAVPFSRRRSLGSDRIQWRLGHGGAAGLSRGEPLQGLAQLDGVDPAFPICDESIGVQRYPFGDRPFIFRLQGVIASGAKQSRATECSPDRDCFVARDAPHNDTAQPGRSARDVLGMAEKARCAIGSPGVHAQATGQRPAARARTARLGQGAVHDVALRGRRSAINRNSSTASA
jgi:hypothetical protein